MNFLRRVTSRKKRKKDATVVRASSATAFNRLNSGSAPVSEDEDLKTMIAGPVLTENYFQMTTQKGNNKWEKVFVTLRAGRASADEGPVMFVRKDNKKLESAVTMEIPLRDNVVEAGDEADIIAIFLPSGKTVRLKCKSAKELQGLVRALGMGGVQVDVVEKYEEDAKKAIPAYLASPKGAPRPSEVGATTVSMDDEEEDKEEFVPAFEPEFRKGVLKLLGDEKSKQSDRTLYCVLHYSSLRCYNKPSDIRPLVEFSLEGLQMAVQGVYLILQTSIRTDKQLRVKFRCDNESDAMEWNNAAQGQIIKLMEDKSKKPSAQASASSGRSSLKEGFLRKLGAKFKSVRRRWWKLFPDKLCYYKSAKDRTPISTISLVGCTLHEELNIQIPDDEHYPIFLSPQNRSRVFVVFCDDEQDKKEWTFTLRTSIKKWNFSKVDRNSVREGFVNFSKYLILHGTTLTCFDSKPKANMDPVFSFALPFCAVHRTKEDPKKGIYGFEVVYNHGLQKEVMNFVVRNKAECESWVSNIGLRTRVLAENLIFDRGDPSYMSADFDLEKLLADDAESKSQPRLAKTIPDSIDSTVGAKLDAFREKLQVNFETLKGQKPTQNFISTRQARVTLNSENERRRLASSTEEDAQQAKLSRLSEEGVSTSDPAGSVSFVDEPSEDLAVTNSHASRSCPLLAAPSTAAEQVGVVEPGQEITGTLLYGREWVKTVEGRFAPVRLGNAVFFELSRVPAKSMRGRHRMQTVVSSIASAVEEELKRERPPAKVSTAELMDSSPSPSPPSSSSFLSTVAADTKDSYSKSFSSPTSSSPSLGAHVIPFSLEREIVPFELVYVATMARTAEFIDDQVDLRLRFFPLSIRKIKFVCWLVDSNFFTSVAAVDRYIEWLKLHQGLRQLEEAREEVFYTFIAREHYEFQRREREFGRKTLQYIPFVRPKNPVKPRSRVCREQTRQSEPTEARPFTCSYQEPLHFIRQSHSFDEEAFLTLNKFCNWARLWYSMFCDENGFDDYRIPVPHPAAHQFSDADEEEGLAVSVDGGVLIGELNETVLRLLEMAPDKIDLTEEDENPGLPLVMQALITNALSASSCSAAPESKQRRLATVSEKEAGRVDEDASRVQVMGLAMLDSFLSMTIPNREWELAVVLQCGARVAYHTLTHFDPVAHKHVVLQALQLLLSLAGSEKWAPSRAEQQELVSFACSLITRTLNSEAIVEFAGEILYALFTNKTRERDASSSPVLLGEGVVGVLRVLAWTPEWTNASRSLAKALGAHLDAVEAPAAAEFAAAVQQVHELATEEAWQAIADTHTDNQEARLACASILSRISKQVSK